MNDANKQSVLSAVRWVLAVAGTILTQRGYVDNETVQSMVGAIMVLLPGIWGVIDKQRAERATKAREVVAVNAGILVADATVGKTPLASPATAPSIIAAAGPEANTSSPPLADEAAAPAVKSTKGKPS